MRSRARTCADLSQLASPSPTCWQRSPPPCAMHVSVARTADLGQFSTLHLCARGGRTRMTKNCESGGFRDARRLSAPGL
jgi:hypothetical protein